MSKKKVSEAEPLKKLEEQTKAPVTKLTHRQYAEWKFSIFEMQKSALKNDIVNMEQKEFQYLLESLDLKRKLHALTKGQSARLSIDQTKDEYEKIKLSIEKELGYSLSDKSIDEITLEIKDLSK
tara:strand:- start:266 stop:637 length:372 start_codon:yes stop_codon:yes gene_type:complete